MTRKGSTKRPVPEESAGGADHLHSETPPHFEVGHGGGSIDTSRAPIISRPRVEDMLSRGLRRKLLMISAPAGFGKTVALSAAVDRLPDPVLWLDATSSDVSASALVDRLLSTAGIHGHSVPGDSSDPMAMARSLVGALLCAFPRGVQIVLDSLDRSPVPQRIESLLRCAVEMAPPSVRFALASREGGPDPWLVALARSAQAARITGERLVFTIEEAESLLVRAWNVSDAVEAAAVAWELTQGWPQGLKEILARVPTAAGADEMRRLAGEPGIHPWMPDSASLPAGPDRQLLLTLSFLPHASPEAVDALTGVPGMWERIVALAGMTPWFRNGGPTHVVLEPSARQMLQETACREWDDRTLRMHRRRTARILEGQGDSQGALELYLAAGDAPAAERVIRDRGMASPNRWDPTPFLHLADRLTASPQLGTEGATVCAVAAWIRGDRMLCRAMSQRGLSCVHTTAKRLPLLVIRASVDCLADASGGPWQEGELKEALEQEELLWPRVWRARCHLYHGELDDAYRLLSGLIPGLEKTTDVFHARWARLCLADLSTQRGHYDGALDALETASTSPGSPDAVLDMRMRELQARLRLLRGEYQTALTNGQDALAMARTLGADDRALAHLAFLSVTAFASGEQVLGAAWLDEARRLANGRTVQCWAALHEAEALRAWSLGRLQEAAECWRRSIGHPREWHEGAWARLRAAVAMLRTGWRGEAEELVDQVYREASAIRAAHVHASALLLRACIAHASGQPAAAEVREEFQRLMEDAHIEFLPAADSGLIRWAAQGLSLSTIARMECGMRSLEEIESIAAQPVGVPLMAPAVNIATLGPLRIIVDGVEVDEAVWKGRMKAKRFFEILLSSALHRVHADEVVELLWPEAAPGRGRHRLQCTVSDLRRIFDETRLREHLELRFRRPYYMLAATGSDIVISHEVFDALVKDVMAGPWVAESAAHLRRAVQLYAGEFLEDARYDRFAEPMRQHLAERMHGVVKILAAHAESPEHTLTWAQRALEHDPYDEDAYRMIIQACVTLGRHDGARAALQALRSRLVDDLGVELPEWALEYERGTASS